MRICVGDVRIRRGFLFFKKSSDFCTRWLEWAVWREVWEGETLGWVFDRWEN